MAKWKEIKANRIQTFDEEIWLYDAAQNVSVKIKVPSRPWTKLDPDFTHWHKVDARFPETAPTLNPDGQANLELKAIVADMTEAMSSVFPPF